MIDAAGGRILRTFDGLAPTPAVLAAIGRGDASGVTLFRHRNVGSPGQLRELSAALQAARPEGAPPLVIGIDQEGGQLQAVGGRATAWPGNLALGAADSAALTEAAGRAIGLEAAAMGATLVFAPVCDVVQRASATLLGTRSFGSDPALVGRLAAAMVAGLQGAGVAAVLKHFPGHGSATEDSHVSLPVVDADAATIRRRDLAPFADGIAAGARAVLPAHLATPALTDGRVVSATVSRQLLDGVLRRELGFDGVTISDALDMAAAGPAATLEVLAVAASAAGMDLLLLVHPLEVEDRVVDALRRAIATGEIPQGDVLAGRARVEALRSWLLAPGSQPDIDVVGCAEHQALARRIAEASLTLVRDPSGLLPLDPERGQPVTVIAPVPVDLTPAETSSYLRIGLADALSEVGVGATEHVAPLDPTPAQVAALVDVATPGVTIVGTFDAVSHPGQVALTQALAGAHLGEVVAVALRSPYDAECYPPEIPAICTYGIQPPQIAALARALVGDIPLVGRLPIELAP